MANSHAAHDEHRPDVGAYIKVFAALMVLTLVTVAISKLHLPRPQAIGLGLAVAVAKASLVAAVFMHLWGEHKLIHKLLLVTAAGALGMLLPLLDCAWLVHKVTTRVPVASQGPGESHKHGAAETMTLPKGGE